MPKVSRKRQSHSRPANAINLALSLAIILKPLLLMARLTIVRKVEGAAQSLLRHVKGDLSITDQESLEDTLDS